MLLIPFSTAGDTAAGGVGVTVGVSGTGGARRRGTGAAGTIGVGGADPGSGLACAASPTVSCLLATVVTDPSLESTVASALVAALVDFAAAYRLDYATALVAESESASPPSVRDAPDIPTPRSYTGRLRVPTPYFTGSFPAGTLWSLRRLVYGLRQAPREWHYTLRTTLATLGFTPSTAGPSLYLRTEMSLPLFYVLLYVDDLVFATADAEALTLVKSEL
ncbi:unnamed protein product [Closterium sp. NIES-53]